MQTCYDLVWLSAQRTPDKIAIVDDQSDQSLTYKELIQEIDVIAAGLKNRGVKKGMRIATILPSLFDHAIVLLALQRLSAIPALINFRLASQDIGKLIKLGNIKGAIILPDKHLAKIVIENVGSTDRVLCIGKAVGKVKNYADCRGDSLSLGTLPRPKPEDIAFIFYTSGTTGLPKGVELSHRTTEHRILWLATHAGFRHGNHNKLLGFMPLSHAIGFYGVFLAALSYNGTYYVQSAFNPEKAVTMIEKHSITYIFAVPQLYFAITRATNYSPEKMASLQMILYGGAEIMPDLLTQIDKEWPAKIFHIYGTTEIMCPLYNPDPVGQHIRLRPGFYCQTRIIEIGGTINDIVARGEEGELIVDISPDQMFSGYLNQPKATEKTIVNGWYHTGDVCLIRKDGDYDLIGRTGDIIRSGGENIHPSEIEPHLLSHQNIKESAVIGIKDVKWGEMVVACIITNGSIDISVLKAHMQKTPIANFKLPKAYLFLNNFPRNAANKILRRELCKIAEEERLNNGQKFIEV